MKRFALVAFAVAFACPALAAPQCEKSVAALKAENPKARFSVLNAGQLHFAEGMFVATPPVSGQKPPGDGAILATEKGKKGATIIWTLGKNACAPFPIPDELARTLRGINGAPGETFDDDSSEDLHL